MPRATDLAHNNITSSSAELSWTSTAPPALNPTFKVRYFVNNGIYHWKYVKYTNTDVILSNLYPGYNYGWQVKVLCDGNNEVKYESVVDYFTTRTKN